MQVNLTAWGAAFYRKAARFEIRQPDGERIEVSPAKVTAVYLSAGCRISTDAILLALQHEIPIYFVDREGRPEGRVWSPRYGSIATLRRRQLIFTRSAAGLAWIAETLVATAQSRRDLLKRIGADRPGRVAAVGEGQLALERLIESLRREPPTEVADFDRVRGYEGAAARSYFQTLGQLVPREYAFEKRSRRPARDYFNCVLNYGYGMLYAEVEGALIKAGLDPYLGVMHADEYNRPALAFDAIEPYRPWIEAIVLQLAYRRLFEPELFDPEPHSGGHYLNTAGKKLFIPAIRDYLLQHIDRNGKRRSRLTHLQDEMYALARRIEAIAEPEDYGASWEGPFQQPI